ncbi:hypothetical protein FOMPIDRAFT_1018306 [Fomitopsis schrenkii]|uniref:Uncharacterized protein n=1 Tax=Fomitopsis schrenkii TaxID=2126942 RepID=S8DWB2_FOMSC|nr:hypothetical protein FOMPIDRAFT_1018306 [Fomitopsis schrenkii]
MSDSSPTGSPSRSDECRIQGWTAPEDAACRALQGSHTPYPYNQATLAHQQQASLDTSFSQPFHFTGQANTMDTMAEAGPSSSWPGSHMHGADFAAMPLGGDQYQGATSYGASARGGPNICFAPYSSGSWQPSLGTTHAETSGIPPVRNASTDAEFPTLVQGWAPPNVRRSLSYGHGSASSLAAVPSMHQANPTADLLPRSGTASPADARPPGGSGPLGGEITGERCRWGGECQVIITDRSASGINRHLRECHVQPWDDRARGYCQWEGSTCSKKLLFYFGFGKHIASVHIRSTASHASAMDDPRVRDELVLDRCNERRVLHTHMLSSRED